MAEPGKTLNQLTAQYLQDVYCFLPLSRIFEFIKVRPINLSGKDRLKALIINAGWSADSVLKVRAPKSEEHIHWGLAEKAEYEKKDLELAWSDLKSNEERKAADNEVG
jgi:hypothetical protein